MFFSKAAVPQLLASLAVAGFVTWLAAWHPFAPAVSDEPCLLEIASATATGGSVSISLDEGHGFAIDRPAEIQTTFPAHRISVALPPGRIRELRVDIEGPVPFEVDGIRLRAGDRDLARPPMSAVRPLAGTAVETATGHPVFQSIAGGTYVSFTVLFTPPVVIPSGDEPWVLQIVGIFAGAFAIAWLALRKWPGLPALPHAGARPRLTIALVAFASTLLSAYPVVFLGKSFVAPNTIAYLLYLGDPTIAGAAQEPVEYGAGSDLGATMWQTLPYSVVESRALTRDHEFPLWNRYNSGGVSLFGQGLSMLGDPLHFIPLLAGGAWWAWDIKFVLAKTLFAIGAGLCAWSLTRRLGASALLGASAAWIGFFAYRFNHPAFFSVCYAPWILLAWLAARELLTSRERWLCAAGLLAANWCELTSGTAKEASMLLLCLNATGLLVLLRGEDRWRRLAPMLWASFLFLLLSAPAWLLFLDALRQAVTIYDVPHAYQMQPALLIALFDSIFSQDMTQQQYVTHPSLNFLVLLGVLWALCGQGAKRPDGALATAATVAAALVLGIVPPEWLMKLPLIGKIEHIYNVFGCVLFVLLLPLAARGIAACLEERDELQWRATWWRVALSLSGLFLFYLGFTQALPASPLLGYRIDPPLHSRFFAAYVPALLLAVLGLPWALRWARERRVAGAVLAAVCLVVLHFRSGMFVETKFDDLVMNPRTGMELAARSASVETVRAALTEPARVCGFSATLSPGYQGVLGLEGIAGPDALHNPFYAELCAAAGFHTAWGWRLMVEEETLAKFKPMYDALNVRFYLREREGGALPLPELAHAGASDLEIFESKEAWPRAFFSDQCASYATPHEFAQLVAQGDGRPFAAMQGEAVKLPGAMTARRVVAAHDYRLTNNTTEFVVSAPGPGMVVLAETFEAGNFEATVDGRPAECLRVNHAFKGVVVDRAGELHIRFTYWPRLLKPALGVSLAGLLLTLGAAALLWRRGRAAIPASAPALGAYSCEA